MAPAIPLIQPMPSVPPSTPETEAPAVSATPGRHARPTPDQTGIWLYAAGTGLCALAGAAAAVSFTAQYRLVYTSRHLTVAAALEAVGIEKLEVKRPAWGVPAPVGAKGEGAIRTYGYGRVECPMHFGT